MAHKVFICHSSKDKLVADAACAALEAHRIPCWIAPRDILAGDEYAASIIDALDETQIVLLIFSHSANDSPQVRREIERAVSKEKIIVPLRIEDVMPSRAMEFHLMNTHWLDALTPPIEQRLTDLCTTIARIIQKRSPTEEPLWTAANSREKEDEARAAQEAEQRQTREAVKRKIQEEAERKSRDEELARLREIVERHASEAAARNEAEVKAAQQREAAETLRQDESRRAREVEEARLRKAAGAPSSREGHPQSTENREASKHPTFTGPSQDQKPREYPSDGATVADFGDKTESILSRARFTTAKLFARPWVRRISVILLVIAVIVSTARTFAADIMYQAAIDNNPTLAKTASFTSTYVGFSFPFVVSDGQNLLAGCAQRNAEKCYYLAEGTALDLRFRKFTLPLYEKSCNGGYQYACDSLGIYKAVGLYLSATETSPQDYGAAIRYFADACSANLAISCQHLGELYSGQGEWGSLLIGAPRDLEKAKFFFGKGCGIATSNAASSPGTGSDGINRDYAAKVCEELKQLN